MGQLCSGRGRLWLCKLPAALVLALGNKSGTENDDEQKDHSHNANDDEQQLLVLPPHALLQRLALLLELVGIVRELLCFAVEVLHMSRGKKKISKSQEAKPQTSLVNEVLGLGLVLEGDVDVLAHDARHLIHLLLHICNRGAPESQATDEVHTKTRVTACMCAGGASPQTCLLCGSVKRNERKERRFVRSEKRQKKHNPV